MLLDVWDKAYMLHYICYGSEDSNMCYQGDKILHPSQEDIIKQFQVIIYSIQTIQEH